MLYLNVKLTSSIKDCVASVLPLSQCWGPTGSFSSFFQEKKKVKPASQPKPASERLREQWREVSVHQGSAMRHGQVQNLFSSWVTPAPWWGMCTLEKEFTGGEKGNLLDYL